MSRDHSSSPSSGDSPPHFNSIVMVSLSDSQDTVPQDVFHTAPENPSLPVSCDQLKVAMDGGGPRPVNQAVNVDAGTQGFVDLGEGSKCVDLGRDSELGFSEVQLKQEMGVNESSHGEPRDVLGESAAKNSKLAEVDLGANSSEDCVEVKLQKGEENMGNCKGKEPLDEHNCCGNVSLSESEKVACIVEGSKSSDGVGEGSGMGGPSNNAETGAEFRNSGEAMNVFDALRALSERFDKEEKNLDNLSLMEVAEACGITFPRPRWWPKDYDPFA